MKQAKQTIQVAKTKTKTEEYQEEVQLETATDRKAARDLTYSIAQKEQSVAQKQRELDTLATELEKRKAEHQRAIIEVTKSTAQLEMYNSRPKSQMITKTRETQYTEMVDKKVRKVITETPMPIQNWKSNAI